MLYKSKSTVFDFCAVFSFVYDCCIVTPVKEYCTSILSSSMPVRGLRPSVVCTKDIHGEEMRQWSSKGLVVLYT